MGNLDLCHLCRDTINLVRLLLSPALLLLSNYLSGSTQFRRFVQDLEEKGTDLSMISLTKSFITIGGLEKYVRLLSSVLHLLSHVLF